jgi:Sulfatase
MIRISCLSSAIVALPLAFGGAALAQTPAKPNIVMIMADDVGIWNISAYHRGMMGGSTPNIDRIAKEGPLFTDYYAQQSCTHDRDSASGRLDKGLGEAQARGWTLVDMKNEWKSIFPV